MTEGNGSTIILDRNTTRNIIQQSRIRQQKVSSLHIYFVEPLRPDLRKFIDTTDVSVEYIELIISTC